MVRFQAAYKAHLLKQQEKVNLELRELVRLLVTCYIFYYCPD